MPKNQETQKTIARYIPLVQFLGSFLGERCEVVLHDTENKEESVVAIANGHISGRTVGAPLTDLALRLVAEKKYEESEWFKGYGAYSQDNIPLHSATYFIKNDDGSLAGLLCLNMDVSSLVQVQEMLDNVFKAMNVDVPFVKGESHAEVCCEESFTDNIEDVTENIIRDVVEQAAVLPERMTTAEKMDIMRTLHGKGVFLLKGSIGMIAKKLAASEATIYRYLQNIER